MPGTKRKITENSDNTYTFGQTDYCIFCFSDDDTEEIFGKYIKTDALHAHSNCLYFASGLSQNGNEDDEYLGFLLPDIQAEINRGKKLNCAYCKKRGATIGCSIKTCRKSFHLNCGIEHGSLHQFFDTFCSFCSDHKPRQPRVKITDAFFCNICQESIEPHETDFCLYPPCCKKNLFHKICLQRQALSAGMYYFKCPLCNNDQEFVSAMKKFGINIPIQDASWELEENAYNELLARPECDAPVCKCPQGRSHRSTVKRSQWSLITCSYCGFHARHKSCDNLKISETTWLCEECSVVNDLISKKKACCVIGDQSGTCSDSLCLSPKVVLEQLTEVEKYYDSLTTTGSHKTKLFQSNLSNAKPPESIDANVKSGKVLSSKDMPAIASCSKQVKELFQIPPVSCKLFDRVVNLRDIKNVTHSSPFKQIKSNVKTRLPKKVSKKLKVDNYFSGNSGQALITSYFGHNNEKNIRL